MTIRKLIILVFIGIATVSQAVELKGSVSDELGEPVVDSPIYMVMKREVFNILKFTYQTVETKTVSVKTDEHGLYQMDIDVDPYFNRFYLYFHGEGYDYARFLRPEPQDVTDDVKAGRESVVNRVLKRNPLWDDLQIVLNDLDPDSERYRILRSYGFPERRETGEDGSETWYYYELRKSFRLVPATAAEPEN